METTPKEIKTLKELVQKTNSKPIIESFSKHEKNIMGDKNKVKNFLEEILANIKNGKIKRTPEIKKMAGYATTLYTRKSKNSINSCQPPLPKGKYTFKDIAGQEKLKEDMQINYIFPFQYPLMFKQKGNLLLYGPPGVGKSFTAKAATSELSKVAFFAPSAGELKGKYEGETEKNIDTMFKCADEIVDNDNYNFSIIFMDEFDALAGSGRDENQSLTRSVNALLSAMDGLKSSPKVSVMAATNFPWNLDEAILRRFTARIFVDLPDAKARKFLIKKSLLENYYYPGVGEDNEERKENINANDKDFVPYKLLGEKSKYGYKKRSLIELSEETKGWFSKKKITKKSIELYFGSNYVDLIVDKTGPNEEGKELKEKMDDYKKVMDVKLEDVEGKDPMFGYSGSDITKVMSIAIQKAAFRALDGYFVKGVDKMKGYWIHDPNKSAGIEKEEIDEADMDKMVNFDLRPEDVEQALKEFPSTIRNESYVELYKYYKTGIH